MIRIGQLIEDIDSAHGGTSSAFLEILSALCACRERATVVAYCGKPSPNDQVNQRVAALPHVTWRFTAPARRLWPGELARTVARDVELGRIDALQIHGVWSADLVSAAKRCSAGGVPYFWTPHGMLLDHAVSAKSLKKRVYMAAGLGSAIAGAAGMVYASTGEMRESVLPRAAPRDTGVVLGLPVRCPFEDRELPRLRAEGRARWGVQPDDELVVFIGRLHPVKRLESTIKAVALARQKRASARLLLLGDGEPGYVGQLRALARDRGVDEAVVFGGWVAGDDKWRSLAAADCAVINSVHENFGYGAVEPLAVGTPVVMTDNLSLAPDVQGAGAGLVARDQGVGEPTDLAEAIAGLLADPGRARMGLVGLRWVRERFSPEAVGERLVQLFDVARRVAGR